jgi:hypothetical protein
VTQVDNRSPFAAEAFTLLDREGQEVRLLVISASFEEVSGRGFEPIIPQPPVRLVDEHFGDPAGSSVRYPSEIALEKPFVDVIVNGFAYAPQREPTRSVTVELLGADIHKRLLVRGDRQRSAWYLFAHRTEPFLKIPIVYERAYGGTDTRSPKPKKHKLYRQNPVGVGFQGVRRRDENIRSELPNLEYAFGSARSGKAAPAGFGAIGRGWSPRLEFAGTFDKNWLETQWPLMPADFDSRHEQAAPLDQQSRVIKGGEQFRLINLTADGTWTFRLPTLQVPVHLYSLGRVEQATPRLDSVLIEPELKRVRLVARFSVRIKRDCAPLQAMIVGHMTGGYLRALLKQKRYVDRNGCGGVEPWKTSYS